MNHNGGAAFDCIRDESVAVRMQADQREIKTAEFNVTRVVFQTCYEGVEVVEVVGFDAFYLFKQGAGEEVC
jgi:hypothetical protein